MKKVSLFSLLIALPSLCFSEAVLSGTAIQDVDLDTGQFYVYLVDTDGSPFSTDDLLSLPAGLSTTDSATYNGFSIIGSGTVQEFFGTTFVDSGLTIQLDSGLDSGDFFGITVFENSSDLTIANDTFDIYTNDTWTLPGDGDTVTFELDGVPAQIGAGNATFVTGKVAEVVPEPSAFAIISGFLALGYALARRRRVAASMVNPLN